MVCIEKIPTLHSKCRYNLYSFLDISPVYLTGGISFPGGFSLYLEQKAFSCLKQQLFAIISLHEILKDLKQ